MFMRLIMRNLKYFRLFFKERLKIYLFFLINYILAKIIRKMFFSRNLSSLGVRLAKVSIQFYFLH